MSAAFDLRALLAIALGGGLGSVLRYIVAVIVTSRAGPGFPWATLLINLIGSFVIGVIFEIAQTRSIGASNIVRLFWMVGILGGFTTFSTFSLDMVVLVQERAAFSAILYGLGSLVVGFACAYAGIVAVKGLQP